MSEAALILFDLSAAFDLIDHAIIAFLLRSSPGFGLTNYLLGQSGPKSINWRRRISSTGNRIIMAFHKDL